ncbi:MAG: protein kinase [Myxococcota bacterium]
MMGADVKVCPTCGAQYDAAADFCQQDGAKLVLAGEGPDPYIGRTLLGQFRIEEVIGAGGMGIVYRARQNGIDRDVAIKILHPELVKNPDAVRRFQREAKVSSALDHPNVVRVFLFGQLPEGNLYLVMPYLRGHSLGDLLRDTGHVDVPRALHIATQICDGVGEAHSQAVVHRDVKPENILLVARGGDPDFVKVLDFGIARFLEAEQTMATQSGLIFGTARYISPEGASGEPTDPRSDVYSIGVLTYQLLCGETPFESKSPVSMLMKHINETPPALRSRAHAGHVPAAVAEVVMRCLSKNADLRYDNAHELAEALRMAATQVGIEIAGAARRSMLPLRPSQDSFRGAPVPTAHTGPTGPVVRSPTLEGAPSPIHDHTAMHAVPPRAPRLGALGTVLLAFVLGAGAVLGGAYLVQQASSEGATPLATIEAQAREALREGRFDDPTGRSVRDLTGQLLREDPNHTGAKAIRQAAADRLRERGVAATERGAIQEARAYYQRALVLHDDPEIRESLAALQQAGSPPRATRQNELRIVPGSLAVGDTATFIAVLNQDISAGSRANFTLQRSGRRPVELEASQGADGRTWVASHIFRSVGTYAVRFEATGQEPVQLRSEVTVARRTFAVERRAVTMRPNREAPPPEPAAATENDGIDWRLPGEPAPAPPVTSRPPPPQIQVTPAPNVRPVPDRTSETPMTTPPPPPAPWTGGNVL